MGVFKKKEQNIVRKPSDATVMDALVKGNIITKFDGQTVKSMAELKTLLTYYKSGETVNIIAMVQGSEGYGEKTFTLTLGTKDIFGDDNNSTQQSPVQEQNPQNGYPYQSPFDFLFPFGY